MINDKAPVLIIPRKAKNISSLFFTDALSAMAPRNGASVATRIEAIELAKPKYHVVTVTSAAVDQYCLKKIGKKPAITVVEKVLFAQSYSDQDNISFLLLYNIFTYIIYHA